MNAKLSEAEKLARCFGCRNNFYNGYNDLGVTRCWSLESAKLVMKKEVHFDQIPPWNQRAALFLSCYHKPRHVYVQPEQTS